MNKILTRRQQEIIDILDNYPNSAISFILNKLQIQVSVATLNRDLAKLVKDDLLNKKGKGRSIKYIISDGYKLLASINSENYFNLEADYRDGNKVFNQEIFDLLKAQNIFTKIESLYLEKIQKGYLDNIKHISPTLYKKELERLTIELSWKSSQIEGNTYSLLETELLLKEKIKAVNKTDEETQMLLNHKYALEYVLKNKNIVNPIKVSVIEDIHTILIRGLGVSRNIRKHNVGITGTSYTPPDNEFQILEYLQKMCILINEKNNHFEKALIAICMISYIQPFEDGNKRTARIIGNALLMSNDLCLLSYRSVNPLDYKKAMLLFYEQNNINAFKELFIKQYMFAVLNYFKV